MSCSEKWNCPWFVLAILKLKRIQNMLSSRFATIFHAFDKKKIMHLTNKSSDMERWMLIGLLFEDWLKQLRWIESIEWMVNKYKCNSFNNILCDSASHQNHTKQDQIMHACLLTQKLSLYRLVANFNFQTSPKQKFNFFERYRSDSNVYLFHKLNRISYHYDQ